MAKKTKPGTGSTIKDAISSKALDIIVGALALLVSTMFINPLISNLIFKGILYDFKGYNNSVIVYTIYNITDPISKDKINELTIYTIVTDSSSFTMDRENLLDIKDVPENPQFASNIVRVGNVQSQLNPAIRSIKVENMEPGEYELIVPIKSSGGEIKTGSLMLKFEPSSISRKEYKWYFFPYVHPYTVTLILLFICAAVIFRKRIGVLVSKNKSKK